MAPSSVDGGRRMPAEVRPPRRRLRRLSCLALPALAAVAGCTSAAEQAFPTRPVTLVVAHPNGAPVDAATRILTGRLAGTWGQPFTVDNRAGDSASAYAAASRATPDGHALVLGDVVSLVVSPAALPKPPFDPGRDFVAVVETLRAPLLLVVDASTPVHSLRELVEEARRRPLRVATTTPDAEIAAGRFRDLAGLGLPSAPGSPASLPEADSGAAGTHAAFVLPGAVLDHLRAGRIRVLAAASRQRMALLPDVPTFAEAGLPGLEAEFWAGIFAPRGTPAAVVLGINRDAVGALHSVDVVERIAALGFDPVGDSQAKFAERVGADLRRYARPAIAGRR